MASYPQPGETFGPYLIIDTLGHGGMGAVFRATQTTLNRQVALKVLLPHHASVEEFRERFSREAGLLATVDSPHIVSIYDFGEYNGCLFIATQLIAGGDLAAYLTQHGALPLPLALEITQQLASALSAAHQAQVVHRDVKPTNVLLGERDGQPHAYLCDFGIARAGDESMTKTGTVIGTYAYLAPERVDGAAATPGTDIYALGCLLIALLTGHAPYQGTDMQVAQQHLNSPIPQWEPTTPVLARLNHIVRTSMSKDPRTRYATAQEMRQDLLIALSELNVPVAASAGAGHVEPTARRHTPIPTAALPLGSTPPLYVAPTRERSGLGRVIAVVVALVLVAGVAVAAVVLLTRSSDDSGSNSSAGQPAPRKRSTPSATATGAAAHLCLDGRRVPGSQPCGEPQGQAGLGVVFPRIPGQASCIRSAQSQLTAVQRAAMTAYRQCDEDLVGGSPVRVTYAVYRDYATGTAYLDRIFRASPSSVGSGLVEYPPRPVGNGWEIARVYDADTAHPFSASVACGQLSKCQDTIGLISFLPTDRFED